MLLADYLIIIETHLLALLISLPLVSFGGGGLWVFIPSTIHGWHYVPPGR